MKKLKGRTIPQNVRSKVTKKGEGKKVETLKLYNFERVTTCTIGENAHREEGKTIRDNTNSICVIAKVSPFSLSTLI